MATLRTRRLLGWRCRLGDSPLFHGIYQRYGLIRMAAARHLRRPVRFAG